MANWRLMCAAFVATVLLGTKVGHAQHKELVRQKPDDTEPSADWLYDDLNAGFLEAARSGKPLMVVFR